MSQRPATNDGPLTSPSVRRDLAATSNSSPGCDVNMDAAAGSEEPEPEVEKMDVSLAEILSLYSQPIKEEQAWAVCYQCCRTLAAGRPRRKDSKSSGGAGDSPRRIEGPGDVRISRDGTVTLRVERPSGRSPLV